MIELNNVSLTYPVPNQEPRTVLESVYFTAERGEMVYLIGPTGSGKSSFLRLLYMDVLPTAGWVRVDEFRSHKMKASRIPFLRRMMGVVFQDFQLLPDRNAYENVAFALYAMGKSSKEVKRGTVAALNRVGLAHKRHQYPHQLSGGEQQRIAIARAIANDPVLLLADEPTGNLDPAVANEIHDLLQALHREGVTVLMATHDYRLVKRHPARTIAFQEGAIGEVDPRQL